MLKDLIILSLKMPYPRLFILSNALFLERKIEEKNDNAKVDKVEGRTGTGEVFTWLLRFCQ